MKKFRNIPNKINVILDVFGDDDKLMTREIAKRLRDRGYEVRAEHLGMFIRFEMLHKYLGYERRYDKCNLYYKI